MKAGWVDVTLGAICESTSNIKWSEYDGDSLDYIDLTSVDRDSLTITETTKVTSDNAPSRARKIIHKDDVIFATTRPTLGRVTTIGQEYHNQICSTGYAVLRPMAGVVITRFIYYFILSESFMKLMESLQRGASYPAVSEKDVKQSSLKIPKSIEEQQQIVAILDDAFAAIEQAQANIEKNIDNAKELFQSKLNEIFSQKGEGWEEKSLGETCVVERGSSPRPIKKYITDSEDGVNWIKIGDVAENAKFVTHTKQKITKEGAEKSRYVGKGDFILSNSMSFGRPYIMKIDGYIHDGWFVLRLPEDIYSDYFWQLLSSSFVKNQINQLAAGAIVKNISGDLVKKVNLSIPPIEIQKNISSKCNSLSLVVKSIISTYEAKLTNLEDLKKSLLEQAFAGKLTCNEPNPTH